MSTNLQIEIPSDTKQLMTKLNDELGISLLAYMVGLDDQSLIYKWRIGTAEPTTEQLDKLKLAYEVFFALAGPDYKDIRFAHFQFISTVELLDEASYARAIRTGMDPDRIRRAAAHYLASRS